MTASARRHAPFRAALILLGGAALAVLLALAGLLAGGGIVDANQSVVPAAHGHSQGPALGANHHGATPLPSIHPAISSRTRRIAFALPAAAVVLAAWMFRRVRLARRARVRAFSLFGRPPGRAPPALRIA